MFGRGEQCTLWLTSLPMSGGWRVVSGAVQHVLPHVISLFKLCCRASPSPAPFLFQNTNRPPPLTALIHPPLPTSKPSPHSPSPTPDPTPRPGDKPRNRKIGSTCKAAGTPLAPASIGSLPTCYRALWALRLKRSFCASQHGTY
ncbi:hypothetical protein SKAU_G00235090 [Synaphobranchus kaupii]|uniref:Uncharacterized protein n=1 Tax=Synaphobranchus kaupii TaxID=118154 RepID=A0A9Q1F6J6_SYNKA|nr:hypothetical protein SKAU_G00235090 [Synaphobranchus kaupii]